MGEGFGGGVRRRGLKEFGRGEEGYKIVRYQLLVLIEEVLKEKGFRKGI